MKNKSETFIPREKAPIVTMGFRFGIGDELCIIDFLDMPEENLTKVSSSVALTKSQAKKLITSLQEFIDKE